MTRFFAPLARWAVTLVLVALAALIAFWIWGRYETDPWTRDGRVRADVVRVAADVGGLVTQVAVRDNQVVRPGQLLFVVDRPRYVAALAQVDATIASAKAISTEDRTTRRRICCTRIRRRLSRSASSTKRIAAQRTTRNRFRLMR